MDIACGEQATHCISEDRANDGRPEELLLRTVKRLPKDDFPTAERFRDETHPEAARIKRSGKGGRKHEKNILRYCEEAVCCFTEAFTEGNSRFAYHRVIGAFGSDSRSVRNRQKQAECLMRGLKIRCFLIRTKSNTGKEKAVNMSIVPDCKSLQKN